MGLELLSSDRNDWVKTCRNAVKASTEKIRKETVRRRVRLFRNDWRDILRGHIWQLCGDPAVAAQLESFLPLVGGSSFISRVANELARPLYARDPLRLVSRAEENKRTSLESIGNFDPLQPIDLAPPSADQLAFEELAEEMNINAQLDQAARLLTPSGKVFLYPRVLAGDDEADQSMVLDIMTADMVTVIPDPRRATKALALIYVLRYDGDRPARWAVWDNKRSFWFEETTDGGWKDNEFGLIPVAEVCGRSHTDTYWDFSAAADLESQTLSSYIVDLAVARKVWMQNHLQLAYKGEYDAFPKSQTLNEKSIIYIGSGDGQLQVLDLQSDPSVLLNVKTTNESRVAANWGISRDRLNQTDSKFSEDVGLQERVAELAQVMLRAERELFKVIKAVSREHPKYKLQQDSKVTIDLGYVHNRTDRETILKIRAEEKRQGIRSPIDDVLEDNPEFGGDRLLALRNLRRAAAERGVVVAIQRVMNAPAEDGTPGQTPEQNGAKGPPAREAAKEQRAAKQETAAGMSGVPPELRASKA